MHGGLGGVALDGDAGLANGLDEGATGNMETRERHEGDGRVGHRQWSEH